MVTRTSSFSPINTEGWNREALLTARKSFYSELLHNGFSPDEAKEESIRIFPTPTKWAKGTRMRTHYDEKLRLFVTYLTQNDLQVEDAKAELLKAEHLEKEGCDPLRAYGDSYFHLLSIISDRLWKFHLEEELHRRKAKTLQNSLETLIDNAEDLPPTDKIRTSLASLIDTHQRKELTYYNIYRSYVGELTDLLGESPITYGDSLRKYQRSVSKLRDTFKSL